MLSLFNIDPIQKINLIHVTPLLSVVGHVLGLGAIIVVFCEVGDVLDLVAVMQSTTDARRKGKCIVHFAVLIFVQFSLLCLDFTLQRPMP